MEIGKEKKYRKNKVSKLNKNHKPQITILSLTPILDRGVYFFLLILFIWKRERYKQREKERKGEEKEEVSRGDCVSWFFPQMATIADWTRPNLRDQNSIWVSLMLAGVKGFVPSPTAFPGHHSPVFLLSLSQMEIILLLASFNFPRASISSYQSKV